MQGRTAPKIRKRYL